MGSARLAIVLGVFVLGNVACATDGERTDFTSRDSGAGQDAMPDGRGRGGSGGSGVGGGGPVGGAAGEGGRAGAGGASGQGGTGPAGGAAGSSGEGGSAGGAGEGGNAGGSGEGGGAGEGGGSGTGGTGGEGPVSDFGKHCTDNSECSHGQCIEGPEGTKVCTKKCVDDCGSDDWTCAKFTGVSDPQNYCVPRFARLCRPCGEDADCRFPNVPSDTGRCVPGGANGSFCGATCSTTLGCPDGYTCEQMVIGGAPQKQCVPVGGAECKCKPAWTGKGYKTECFHQNGHGTCRGERSCDTGSLSACTAATPAQEVCDGRDNNCDGVEDNGSLCADELSCTEDICDGIGGCKHTLKAKSCLIGFRCYAENEVNPVNPCQACLPSQRTDAWSIAVNRPCDDSTPCTRNDRCNAFGTCVGDLVNDMYEPNETIGTARGVGTMNDDSELGKAISGTLAGNADADWYSAYVYDSTGHLMSDVVLKVTNETPRIKACVLAKCADDSELHYECLTGSYSTSIGGYQGCCIVGSKPTLEMNIDRCGIWAGNDDSVYTVFGVRELAAPNMCTDYSFHIHF